jgi:hypothetical protein
VGSALLQTDDEGESTCRSGFASHNVFLWAVPGELLGDGGGETRRGECKCEKEMHFEWGDWLVHSGVSLVGIEVKVRD